MLQYADLLKHLDFRRKLLHIVQSKGKKDGYVPLSDHIIRGLRKYITVDIIHNKLPTVILS